MHLALVDEAALGLVHELDRILDRDDVIGAIVVAVIHHAGKRRRFARSGRPGHEHETARQHAKIAEDLRRAQVIEAQNDRGNIAKYGAGAAVLVEGIHPEAGKLGYLKGKIGLEELFVCLPLLVVHDVVHHAVHFLMGKRRHVHAFHVAVHPDHRWHAGGEVQVRSVVLDSERQELRDIYGH